ncbi:MAG: transcriptional regulator [Piscirickettsiaceae bacterium]|nr:MAG: transcriptional regulator [Piscirickettsiaceae bacterium]PCI70502.1 MAG: transcriptional regulator [Piscirickettsiaceae bacterium]
MSNENDQQDSIMKFPCVFAIKTMGLANTNFDAIALDIVRRHCVEASSDNVKIKLSKTGKYISVSITITAQSKKQMDAIYQDLTDCEHVLMSL